MACLAGASGVAYADYVWNGGETITDEAWNTQSNWTLTDGYTFPVADKGPGVPESNAWKMISISNASGSVGTLEGWNFGLALSSGSLTVENIKKIQNGGDWGTAPITLDNASLTLNVSDGHQNSMNISLNNGSQMILNLSSNRTSGATTVNYGDFGSATLGSLTLGRKDGATGNYTSNLTIGGTISDAVTSETTTLHTIALGTVGEHITLGTITSDITAEGYKQATGVLTASQSNIGKYSVALADDGTLNLYYVTGSVANFVWDGGDGSWADAEWNGSDDFADGNNAIINSGTVTVEAGTTASAATLDLNGGGIVVAGSLDAGTLTVASAATVKLSGGTLTTDALNTAQPLEVTGDSTLNVSADSSAVLTGTGNLTKGGTGTLNLGGSAHSTLSGELTITGGTVKWGTSESSENSIAFSKITVDGASSQFWLSHKHADMSATTDVELKNGGKLYSDDTDFATDHRKNNQIAFNNLNVTGGSGAIQYNWGGSFSFETLTGEGTLNISNGGENSWTIIKEINNYSGTIASGSDKHTLKLGSVNLANGKNTVISSKFGAIGDTVTKTGAGTLALTGNGADAATLDIQGGTVRWGSAGNSNDAELNTAVLGFSKVIIGSGTTLEDSHRGGNTAKFDIEMNGGTLYAHAQRKGDGNTLVNYGTLTLVTGTTNTMDQTWKSCRNFDVLTGGEANADVAATKMTIGGSMDGNIDIRFSSVTDFNGTIQSDALNNNGQKLTIGGVNQAAGFNAVINAQATLADGFTKTGEGSLTLSKDTVLGGAATLTQGTVSAGNLSLKGNTLTINGGSLQHDHVTYTAASTEASGTIVRTGDGNLGLFSDGAATTLTNLTLTAAEDKAYSVTMENVNLVSTNNKSIWLTGTATKEIHDVTTGGTLHIGEGTYGNGDATVASISGTATVHSVQVGANAQLTVSGTLNMLADCQTAALTLSGGTISIQDHAGTILVTSLTVTDDSVINADLVIAENGSLDMSAVVTMGCAVTFGAGMELTADSSLDTDPVLLFKDVESLTLGTTAITQMGWYDANGILASVNGTAVTSEGQYLIGYWGKDVYISTRTPEPATTTLSLLALAGMAARRRRH